MATRADRGEQEVTPAYVAADEADETIAALYRAHAGNLVGMIWAYLGDRSSAEDIVQEAFLRMRPRLPGLRDPASAPAYLRSTAFNLARSRMRHYVVVRSHHDIPPSPLPSAEEGTMLRADQQEVAAGLRRLSHRQRACLVLRYYADMTDGEIAATLGLSPSSVKTHIARGLSALESHLTGRL